MAAQRKLCKDRALEICGSLVVGKHYAMETGDIMQAEGALDKTKFYICRVMEWDDGATVKLRTEKRGNIGDNCNVQLASKGGALVRVCYFPLDCNDRSGLVFLDSGSECTASGLGFRRALGPGTFQQEEQAGMRTRRAATSTAPAWARWHLAGDEKAAIEGALYK